MTRLGRPVRAELGGLTTVGDVLAAARGEAGDPDDPAVAAGWARPVLTASRRARVAISDKGPPPGGR